MQDRVGMEAPGMSLFQGSDSIQINAAFNRLEEKEEQQDSQRRDEELKAMFETAFDDLDEEDDGSSSVNSSNFQDASRDADHNVSSSIVNDSSIQQISSDKGPIYQNDIYTLGENVDYAMSTPFPQSDDKRGSPISDIHKQFDIYNQVGTPLNSHKDNSTLNSTSKRFFELPRPPNLPNPMTFPNDLRPQINENYTMLENSPFNSNYHTPANHYDVKNAKFSNNGYSETYDNNISQKDTNDIYERDNNTTSDHYNHCYQTSPNGKPIVNDSVNAYKTADYNSKEHLEVLYTVKTKELKCLREELKQLQIVKEEEKNELMKKLELAQAEVERSEVSRNQARNALIDAKTEIIQLQSQVESYKEKVAVLEKTNKNMSEELSVAKDSIRDLQQKIAVLERVQINDKTHEKFIKQVQDKHVVEMQNMQSRINVLTAKLDEKESMYNSLENKLAEIRRAHEALMVEKGKSINQLAKELESSQNQCRNLMATNNAQEIMQLKNQVKLLNQHNEESLQTIQELKYQLDVAKSDASQYDSLLTTAIDEESDSIRQLKLGEFYSKSKDKSNDDIMNKLRVELQRCVAGHVVKRKEISRLENTLAQKNEELEKAYATSKICQQEAARYAERVNELEQELNNFVTEHSVKANSHIQKLTANLREVKEQNAFLMTEKQQLQKKLEETLASQEETIKKFDQETMVHDDKQNINEYNKQYLEIHEKAVERARKEAQLEIVQLEVQLEQTQKELDRVKQLYIEVCGTKEQLINDHEDEIKTLKEKYASFEIQVYEIDHLKSNLDVQLKINKRLTQECESLKKKNIELEKDLSFECRKKLENARKIHQEIERAKEEALTELRNTHPERQISILLPDHCSEHSDKIAQLENDCKRLEEKLSCALEEQKKMADLQHEDLKATIKTVQMEIIHETLKKKYSDLLNEKNNLSDKLTTLQQELIDLKNSQKTNDINDVDFSLKIGDLESDKLKNLCENLFKEKMAYQSKIIDLESKLIEYKNKISKFESNRSKSNESLSTTRTELEQELSQYKELVKKLSDQLNSTKDFRKDEERLKQLELELKEKEVQLQRLEDLEKIKEERDQLITKLKNQAQQFEEYIKNQKQVSAELNLSPRNTVDTNELQKLREISIKKVREEMEQKVTEELRGIEDQHKEKRKAIEDKYKNTLTELKNRYAEKTKELEAMKKVMVNEKIKLQSSFKAQEQIVTQMIEVKIKEYKQELLSRKLTNDKLQAELQQKERDVEDVKTAMAQVMSEWVAEIQAAKEAEVKLRQEVNKLEETAQAWKEEEKELKNSLEAYKHKYQSAKLGVQKYKKYAEDKENFLMSECKRIEDGYKKAISQVQQNFDEIVSTQERQMEEKLKELESQYEEKLQQLRRNMKYKDKH